MNAIHFGKSKHRKDHPIFIIAEAGVNHNGNINQVFKLIESASKIGADAIKFQTFIPEKNISKYAKMANYQIKNIKRKTSQLKMIKDLALPFKSWEIIKKKCDDEHILFLSTPYDRESVDLLYDLVPLYKIPSGEINNYPYLSYVASKKKPILLSTGMSFLYEIDKAIQVINNQWRNAKIIILHCTSDYPAHYSDINLRVINTLQHIYPYPIGYSDHSLGIIVPIAAAALGATVIEKHFTLNINDKGPDHKASLDPKQFSSMVKSIREVESVLGTGKKKPSIAELKTRLLVRRSLVASRSICANEIITEQDIEIKRPGTGLEPNYFNIIIGKKLIRSIKKDQLFSWNHFN